MVINWLMSQGGPVMYPLAFCSLAGLTLIIERCVFWSKEKRKFDRKELKATLSLLAAGKLKQLEQQAFESDNPMLRRIAEILPLQDRELLADAVAVEINNAEARAQRYLSALSTIVAVSPLLGILGTVLGIIDSFSVLQDAMLNNPTLVGAGLAEALITTAAGLSIAVPCLLAGSLFKSISDRHLRRLESFGDELDMQLALARKQQPSSERAQAAPLRGVA